MKKANTNLFSSLIQLTIMCGLVLLPAVVLASDGGGHADSGVVLKDFAYRCFNFALLVGLWPIL
jgi:hypothetical protein